MITTVDVLVPVRRPPRKNSKKDNRRAKFHSRSPVRRGAKAVPTRLHTHTCHTLPLIRSHQKWRDGWLREKMGGAEVASLS